MAAIGWVPSFVTVFFAMGSLRVPIRRFVDVAMDRPRYRAHVLDLPQEVVDDIVRLAVDGYPYEVCGLLAGPPGGSHALGFYPCRNAAESARVYTLDPRDHLRAERDAEDHGWDILGVVHSHTHTEAYPSPTDVAQAPDPGWHYAIVSRPAPSLRSYRIVDGEVVEEPVTRTLTRCDVLSPRGAPPTEDDA